MTTSATGFTGHEIGQVSLPPLGDGPRTAFPYSISGLTAPGTMQSGTDAQVTDLSVLKAHPLLGVGNGAVSLLKHGHRHLATLEQQIGQTFAHPAKQAVIGAYLDSDIGYHRLRVESTPDFEIFAEDFCNAIFDIAGAFRASLDKLAWRAVSSITSGYPKDPRGVKFPIADTSAEWANQSRAWKKFDTAHCAFIESFQPYHGTNGRAGSWYGPYAHQLTLLRDLANDDKHRDSWPVFLACSQVMLRAALFPADRTERFAAYDRMDKQFVGLGEPMEVGLEVMQVRLFDGAQPEIKDAGRVVPQVALPEKRIVIPTLQRIERFVHLILSEFAQNFP
jgi:hypothetical protein